MGWAPSAHTYWHSCGGSERVVEAKQYVPYFKCKSLPRPAIFIHAVHSMHRHLLYHRTSWHPPYVSAGD